MQLMHAARAAIVCALGVAAPAIAQQCVARPAELTSFGYASNDGFELQPGIISRNFSDNALGVRYLRMQIAAPGGGDWRLTIRDASLRPVETLSSATFATRGSQWTRRIYTQGRVSFDLDTRDPDLRIQVPTIIVMPEKTARPYYSIRGDAATFKDLYGETATERRGAGDHVGMLSAMHGNASWCCSAVAVGPDLVLTNWHCGGDPEVLGSEEAVWSQPVCNSTLIDFSWDGDGVDREFACKEVVDRSREADFALLRVQPVNRVDVLRPVPIRAQGPALHEELRIIHHPACLPKQVTEHCEVAEIDAPGWRGGGRTDFKYACDTENGSSGAPLFDKDDRLVGIHHLGFQLVDGRCDELNKGVAVPSVLKALKADNRRLLEGGARRASTR